MTEKKSFTVKFNEAQIEFSNDVLSKAKELFGTESKSDTLFKILEQWDESLLAEGDPLQAGVSTIPDNLEDLCALDNLQKMVDPKDGLRKWFCLKNAGPDKKGKPILMVDGKDRESIQLLCKQCGLNFLWRERRSKLGKARAYLKDFGKMDKIVKVSACQHPAYKGTQLNLGDSGYFYCQLTENSVTLERTCVPSNCKYLTIVEMTLRPDDIEGYKELTKQLEELK